MENQRLSKNKKKISFHINASTNTKSIITENGCPQCKEHFEDLSHKPLIVFKDKSENPKKVDWSATFDKIEEYLTNSKLFMDFRIDKRKTQFLG